ncbi:hypothetical protein QJQ58_21740 [Paenibacillus dendritiformis]|nr:hypothetical protein [Paenibacillus dendritiformis]WGU93160.1 hypothetical protein QJQ58_21740 [Paenibacillus dendritiformis]
MSRKSAVGAKAAKVRGMGDDGRKLLKVQFFDCFCCEKKNFLQRCINFVK